MLEKETERKSRARLTREEREQVRTAARYRSPVIYEIIRREGEEELHRPTQSLLVAGTTAGIAIGFSVLSESLLHAHLPDEPWRPLVENFGYTVGFLIVILARLQLFTENTITAVLPICAYPTLRNFLSVARLWGLVLFGNMLGTLLFAAFIVHAGALSAEIYAAFGAVSEKILEPTFMRIVAGGAVSGFLIACLVWLAPSAEGSEFWAIILFTYLIALGDFAHVVAGGTEAWFLFLDGRADAAPVFLGYVLPALIGNVLGGTVLFTLLAYTQVSSELDASGEQQAKSGRAAKARRTDA